MQDLFSASDAEFDRVCLDETLDNRFNNNFNEIQLQPQQHHYPEHECFDSCDAYLESPVRSICTCEIRHECLDCGFNPNFWSQSEAVVEQERSYLKPKQDVMNFQYATQSTYDTDIPSHSHSICCNPSDESMSH